jgi:hypothetical protein
MWKLYKYKVVREDLQGNRGKRAKTYYSYEDNLKIGSLYSHLGSSYPGTQRVLSLTVKEFPE